jgi:hypothetical protein
MTTAQVGPAHYVLTLTGSAQLLSSVLAADVLEVPVGQLMLQADSANAAVVGVGFSNAVTAASCAATIPAAVAGVPAAPLLLGPFRPSQLFLSQIWVIGTNGQKLRIGVIPAA